MTASVHPHRTAPGHKLSADTVRRLIASPVYERLRFLNTPREMAMRLAYEFADRFGDRVLLTGDDYETRLAAVRDEMEQSR